MAATATTNAIAAINTVKIRRGLISCTPRFTGHHLTAAAPSFNRGRFAIPLKISRRDWVVVGPDVRPKRQNGPWPERPGSFFLQTRRCVVCLGRTRYQAAIIAPFHRPLTTVDAADQTGSSPAVC